MTDESKRARAEHYRAMMNMDAWKDLERYANEERDASMRRIDVKSASDLSLGDVCEERGIRKGILKLMQHAELCREGV